ncbi:MAG TPA: hypothetical protein VGI74_19985 [Streptosporangiaceae bacterium]
MSDSGAVAPVAASSVAAPPVPAVGRKPGGWVQHIGYAVLGLQFAAFLAWSATLYSHFALTSDFATYAQPWFLIAHGNLDPYSTIATLPFWQNDSEFLLWLVAPFSWLGHGNLPLLWLQDAGVAGAEAVAFTWLCELARRHCQGRNAAWLCAVGLVLLAGNPWIWWAVSFDVHEETLVIVFAVLLAWDLANGRRRAWVWVLPVLAGGAPSATYLAGIGLGGMLAQRRWRSPGAIMVLTGLAYSVVLVLMHGDLGAPLARHYGWLAMANGHVPAVLTFTALVKVMASHPLRVLRTLWDKRLDIVANLAPAGPLGAGMLMVLPLIALIVVENTLSVGYEFAAPLFQSLPIYILLPVGTVAVLARIAARYRWAAPVLGAILVAQTLGWAAVWGPQTAGQWLRVPTATAATLAGIQARIPASAEVIASQGIVGRFAGRAHVYPLSGPVKVPVYGSAWFVITPLAGTEIMSTASAEALIGELAGPFHAQLVTHANGVWAFRWNPTARLHTITVPSGSAPLPAWAAAGHAVIHGPVPAWHVTSTGGEGYVADGLAWQEPPGHYQAQVTLSATRPVNVEVWNDNGNRLLARQTIPATTGVQTVTLAVDATIAYRASTYPGWGPFRADFEPPPPGQRIEVRVWSPGGSTVNVYGAGLSTAHPASQP